MKVRPIFFSWIVSVLFIYTVVPAPMPWNMGVYNPVTMSYWCSTDYSCWHELGHLSDQKLGWVSHGPEWNRALEVLIMSQMGTGNRDEKFAYFVLAEKVQHHPFWYYLLYDPDSEIYADILAMSDCDPSNMPASLRSFYDWSWIERMQK